MPRKKTLNSSDDSSVQTQTEPEQIIVKTPRSFEKADQLIEEIRKAEKAIHPKTKDDVEASKANFTAAYAALNRIKKIAGDNIALNDARIDALLRFILKFEETLLDEGTGAVQFNNGNRVVVSKNPSSIQFLDNDEHEAGKEILSLGLPRELERRIVRIQVMCQEAEDHREELVAKGAKRIGRGNNRKVQFKVATQLTEYAEKRLTRTLPGEITEI